MQGTVIIFIFSFWSVCYAQHRPQYVVTPEFMDHGKGHCASKGHMRNFSATSFESMCVKPKNVIIDILPEDISYTYSPSKVAVKRCVGHCVWGMTCVPKKTTVTQIAVRRVKRNTAETSCGYVNIEEHVSCKCDCRVMPEDCNELQEYNEKECQCMCRNRKDHEMCVKPKGKWNMDKCECN